MEWWGGGGAWPSPGDTAEPADPALPDDPAPVPKLITALGLSRPSPVFCPLSAKESRGRGFIFGQKLPWPRWETSILPGNQENTRNCWVFSSRSSCVGRSRRVISFG